LAAQADEIARDAVIERLIRGALCAMILPIGLEGCIFFGAQNVRDPRLVSVDFVDPRFNEAMPWNHAWKPLSPWTVRVTFYTKANLRHYYFDLGQTVGWDAAACDAEKHMDPAREMLLAGGVLDEHGEIEGPDDPPPPVENNRVYRVYFEAAYQSIELADGKREAVPPYDLVQSPEDVCLLFEGGDMIGDSYHSNTIVIPKDALIAARVAAEREMKHEKD
jgi:hypothetical protein